MAVDTEEQLFIQLNPFVLGNNYLGFKAVLNKYILQKKLNNQDTAALISGYLLTNIELTATKTTTPLHFITQYGQLVWLQYLLGLINAENIKSILEQRDDDGNTPAHIAAIHKHRSFIAEFRKHNVDFKIKNNDNKMVTELISEQQNDNQVNDKKNESQKKQQHDPVITNNDNVTVSFTSTSENVLNGTNSASNHAEDKKNLSPNPEQFFAEKMNRLIKNGGSTASFDKIIKDTLEIIPVTQILDQKTKAAIQKKKMEEIWVNYLSEVYQFPEKISSYSFFNSSPTLKFRTPLQAISHYGQLNLLSRVLPCIPARQKNAIINQKYNNETALSLAVAQQHVMLVRELVQTGADTSGLKSDNEDVQDILGYKIRKSFSYDEHYQTEVNDQLLQNQNHGNAQQLEAKPISCAIIMRDRHLLASQLYVVNEITKMNANLNNEISSITLPYRIKAKMEKIRTLTVLSSYFSLPKEDYLESLKGQHAIIPNNFKHHVDVKANVQDDISANQYAMLLIESFKNGSEEDYNKMIAGGSFVKMGLGSMRTADLLNDLKEKPFLVQIKERDHAITVLNHKITELEREISGNLMSKERNLKTLKAKGLYHLIKLLQDPKHFHLSVANLVEQFKSAAEHKNAYKDATATLVMSTTKNKTSQMIDDLALNYRNAVELEEPVKTKDKKLRFFHLNMKRTAVSA